MQQKQNKRSTLKVHRLIISGEREHVSVSVRQNLCPSHVDVRVTDRIRKRAGEDSARIRLLPNREVSRYMYSLLKTQ